MYVCVGVCVARYAATAERTCKKYQEKREERKNSGIMQQQRGQHDQLHQEPQQHQHNHHLHEQPPQPQQPQQAPSATPDAGAKRKRIQPQLLQHYTQEAAAAAAAAAAASHMGDMSIAAQERGEQRDAVWTSMSSTSLPAAAAAAPAAAAISNAPNNPTVRITIQLLNGEQLQATSPAFSRANHVTCPLKQALTHVRVASG